MLRGKTNTKIFKWRICHTRHSRVRVTYHSRVLNGRKLVACARIANVFVVYKSRSKNIREIITTQQQSFYSLVGRAATIHVWANALEPWREVGERASWVSQLTKNAHKDQRKKSYDVSLKTKRTDDELFDEKNMLRHWAIASKR